MVLRRAGGTQPQGQVHNRSGSGEFLGQDQESVDNAHKPAPLRLSQETFSSHTNGDIITLDGTGKGTYDMPDDWWKDLARLPRADFDEMDVFYRVVASLPGTNSPMWSVGDGDPGAAEGAGQK